MDPFQSFQVKFHDFHKYNLELQISGHLSLFPSLKNVQQGTYADMFARRMGGGVLEGSERNLAALGGNKSKDQFTQKTENAVDPGGSAALSWMGNGGIAAFN